MNGEKKEAESCFSAFIICDTVAVLCHLFMTSG